MKLYNCSPFCPLCDQWSPFLLFTPMTAVQPIPVTPSAHYQMITQFVDTSQIVTSLPKEIRSWNWISANNLTLNTRKTKQIIFDIGKMSVQTSSLSTSVVTVRAYAGLSWTTKTSAVTKKMYNCISPLDVTFTKVRKNIWHRTQIWEKICQDIQEQPSDQQGSSLLWNGNCWNTSVTIDSEARFSSPWAERVPTMKEAPATSSSSTEIWRMDLEWIKQANFKLLNLNPVKPYWICGLHL